MSRRRNIIINLFIIICMIFAHIPCPGTIATPYGTMGEVKPILLYNNEITIEQEKKIQSNVEEIQTVQVFNILLLVLAIILFRKYASYILKLPARETLVQIKVRMNN